MRNIYLPVALLILASCGGGGGGGGGEAPTPPTPAPGISFSATPTSVLLNNTSTFSWSTTNATSCTASGSNNWTGTKGTSGTEDVSIDIAGNTVFTLSCSGAGGTRNASVTVEGYRQTDGVVVDGYISGADVFIDENANFIADASENATTSDNDGKFTIKYANGSLVSIGGTDLDSQTLLDNLLITHKLDGYSDFKAITPVTSVEAFMEVGSNLNNALGIDSSIDISVTDPVALKGDDGIYDYLYEKGNQLTVLAYALQNITNDLNTTTETTQDYFKAIAEEVEKEFNETSLKVDIETETFINKTFENVITAKSVTINNTAKENTVKALSGVLPIVEVKASDDLTTSVIRFAVSTLQEDIKAVANGTASAEKVASYTTNVIDYIAQDQNINSDDITPDISAIDDSTATEEDTLVSIQVLANDSYISTAPINITATNGDSGTVEVAESSPEQIIYSPNTDYNGSDTFSYTITQGDKVAMADVNVTITPVNDAPSIDIASIIQAAENQTAVTSVSVSDVDEDELTLTLGGTDANSFNLSSDNVLSFKEAPDYETKTSYSITLTLTDGTETVTKDFTIIITNVNDVAPEFTSEATFSAAENQTAIGTVTATDAEDDEVTFAISGDELAITAAGVLTFVSAPDYETKSSYTATVIASDGTNSTTQSITVNVTDVNEAPAFTSSTTFSAAENQTAIGTVAASDVDGDTITYSISGSDIIINSTSGVIAFASAPDYETKSVYVATVTASDGINQSTQDITIYISDVSMQLFVKTFTVSGSELFIYTVENIDTIQSIKAIIEDSNGYEEDAQKLTFAGKVLEDNRSLNDYGILNEATLELSFIPIFTSSATFSAAENQTAIGTVTATDANGDEVAFIVSGSELAITSAGVLTFASAPDFETKSSYTATVSASNGINATTQAITINVTDVNEAPVFSSSATYSAAENQTAIGTVTATDAESGDVTFTISGTELTITSAGVLTFVSEPDYETKTSYAAIVTASDGTNSTTQDITVYVTNVNDNSPAFTSSANFSAAENQTAIGTVAASDADGDAITYSITGSDIAINSSSGVIAFTSAPDYETKSSYTATVTVSDGINSVDQNITVNVTNVNDVAPQFTSDSTFSVSENQIAIGTVTASDAEGDGITYSISGSEIIINSSTGVITFASAPDYEIKSSYTTTVTASDGANSTTQDITVDVLDVDELSTANDCNYIVNDASAGEFRYCWEESQSTSGSEYSANVVEPLTITFADESIEIPSISYAEKLYVEYGIVLESSGGDWTNDQAYAIYQTLKKIPQNVRNEANDNRVFSKWALTDLQIQDDISFDKEATNIEVTIESNVFENANPRIATVDGKKGIYFSNKLHNALVRYVTNNGKDSSAVNTILVERYGVTTVIDDYIALTGEQASRFQDFQAEELIAIISMFEEMPSGFHKIEGLDYLVRRINGADNPYYPEAPAIAWDGSGYIEFMEKAFNTVSIDYLHRLILHEKAHFLWAKIFDDELKNNWIELGGWYECTEKESGWCTTKQTEFVSAYAHLKNPNEDMAESLSYFIVNPDALKSRSLAKYEFVRDRIMQGNIYISQIQENLTFKVYNLYPDYVFPGKVKKLFVSVDGAPTEDKTVTVEIKLHALDEILEGAAWARMRIFSTADTYFDLYLNPQNGQNLDTTLRGTFTLSKYAKSGFWKTSQLVLSDEVGNLRMEGANDFGWRMYVNNPKEDLDKPLYVADSMTLTKSLTTIENQEVDVITALWDIDEAFPRENQGCFGALNDENPSTYSFQKYSPQTYSGNYVSGKCLLEYVMPSYMPSGTYRLNYIKMIDEAGNESRNYFASPSGVDTGDNFAGDQLDELAKEVLLETSNPDTIAPELDLNNISINATPTNPDNPNGETIVKFTFRVKDDISGYKVGYYKFRDPQGLTSGYYHYPERRSEIFPSAEDLDWYEYTSTVVLPAGSAPGTWGVVELTLRDRALNFKTYNFTEIISFVTE